MKKKIFAGTLAFILVLSITTPVLAANNWTVKQELAHQLADLARSMGFPEDSGVIKMMQDIFAAESGEKITGSYYYSARTGKTYAVSNSSGGGYSGSNIVYFDDGSLWDGTEHWYYNKSSDYYYYYNSTGGKVRGTPNWNANPAPAPTPAPASKNKTGYNYSYKNIDLYAGRIFNVQSYVTKSDAEYLARYILSLAQNYDLKEWAACGWLTLNIKGARSFSEIAKYIPHYNSGIDLTTDKGKDALNLAYELLFRRQAESAGYTYVGRILPSNYCYYWIEEGKIYFRTSTNGANYTFPDYANNTKNNPLYSPY